MSITVYGYKKPDKNGYLRLIDMGVDEEVNWSNSNAEAILNLLGLNEDGVGSSQTYTIPDIRRALIRAKATFERRAHLFTRKQTTVFGAPREGDDGVTVLRPLRFWEGGVDEDYLARQVARFEVYVERLAKKGAETIGWA